VRLLITSDLHLVSAYRACVLAELTSCVAGYDPQGLLVAGDLALPREAEHVLGALRALLPEGPIGVTLGNHDFWVRGGGDQTSRSLDEIIERYWAEPAKRFGIVLLDRENLVLHDLTVCGAYGHYDLGFAVPKLTYAGITVHDFDYLAGRLPVPSRLRWRDFDQMPPHLDPRDLAHSEVMGLERRLAEANGAPVWVVLHTPPFEELIGLPGPPVAPAGEPPLHAFFRAYLGNRSMGDLLFRQRSRLSGIFCGHTHRPTGLVDFGGFIGINIGSDYGLPRACLLDSAAGTVTRVLPGIRPGLTDP
jgi:Icc-related predicted phosphoesterase